MISALKMAQDVGSLGTCAVEKGKISIVFLVFFPLHCVYEIMRKKKCCIGKSYESFENLRKLKKPWNPKEPLTLIRPGFLVSL